MTVTKTDEYFVKICNARWSAGDLPSGRRVACVPRIAVIMPRLPRRNTWDSQRSPHPTRHNPARGIMRQFVHDGLVELRPGGSKVARGGSMMKSPLRS